MEDRNIQIGSLTIRISIDSNGALHGVSLPAAVPADLTADHFSRVLNSLEGFPLRSDGPPFMEKVWKRMAQIPWGHALTYQELAKEVGSPGASRAVGQACACNPLPLIVPCHRVLAQSGLGGFAYGATWKSALLTIETEPRPR